MAVNSLCVFKIGLTSNPLQRRQSYLEQNFMSFVVIHKVCRLELLAMLEMLEAALIAEFHDNQRCCRNCSAGRGEYAKEGLLASVSTSLLCLLCSYKCCAAQANPRLIGFAGQLFLAVCVISHAQPSSEENKKSECATVLHDQTCLKPLWMHPDQKLVIVLDLCRSA